MEDTKIVQDYIKSVVEKMLSGIKNNRNDMDARTKLIRESLLLITQEFTTEMYSFNLAMDVFVEAAYKDLSECLLIILNETDLDDDPADLDVSFAAYYALSLIMKKQDDIDGLAELIDDKKFQVFRSYPLHYEVHSRYYKRVDKFKEALSCDKRAINILSRKKITNLALCISYASTVCNMLRKRDSSLADEDIVIAKEYIDSAIEFNPDYPKYYFLKAQIVFLSALHSGCDLPVLESAMKQAFVLIDEYADVILYEFYKDKNVFIENERAEYDSFKSYIEATIQRKRSPRFVRSNEELDLLKKKILSAQNQDVCVSSFLLPPIPKLHKDDKYFFVCYSSKDFRSVYCDLIELYKNKIPFIYDERLTHGVGWQDQVRQAIDNENCVGVVFYLSRHVLFTEAVFDEMKITEDCQKPNFCVNLEGSTLPSKILTDVLIERYQKDPNNYVIPGEKMKMFLNFFSDNHIFTHKFKENGDDGTNHFDSFVDAIKGRFQKIIIGD